MLVIHPPFLDADTTTVSATLLGIAVISRVINALLAVLAGNTSKSAAEFGLDANTAAVGTTLLRVTVVGRVVNADLARVLALDAGDAAAEGRLDTDALAVLAAVAAGVDLFADLARGARCDLEAARALGDGRAGDAEKGENGEGDEAHGEG